MAGFSALHVAMTGLRAAQLKMDTASNNISNANTEGYTRQRVELATRFPQFTPDGQIGSGVDVVDIIRLRDTFLDTRVRSASASLAETDVRSEFLTRAELVTGEPDVGVTALLDGVWASFEDLALDPSDRASRQAVVQELVGFATRVNQIAGDLENLRQGALSGADATISQVNTKLTEVARLNVSILEAGAQPGTPNDLLDQRDRLVDEIAELTGASTAIELDGSVRISLNGMSLVSGADARPLDFDASTGQVTHTSGVAVTPRGKLGGYMSVYGSDLTEVQAQIDTFATELADAMNSVHQAGYNASGAGGPIFSYDPGAPAATLSVAISDADELATAAAPGPPFAPHDATVPENLAGLRDALVAAGGTASLSESYRTVITTLGQQTAAALGSAVSQQGLVDAAVRARQGTHGVSVDEEMVSLMEAQRMYEAAARVISSIDEAMDVVINRMGLVGR